jgi:putative peptidoglycan lipid II flippase
VSPRGRAVGTGRLGTGRLGTGLLGAAVSIAGITVLARAAGFGRLAVLTRTLGTSCVGDTYQAVNQLPNVLYEVVAGGALAGLVVPVLAGAVARGDREEAGRTTSALLTWVAVVLVPVALLGALVAPLLVRLLVGDDPTCGAKVLRSGARMLVVFLPQVVLYGFGIVLAGVLQAHRRFTGPALAPLLSSLVVAGVYLLYAAEGGGGDLGRLTRSQELTLSLGTTLGVAVLSLSLLVPLRAVRLPLRPTLTFPSGTASQVRRLALAGVAGLAAQQIALLVALRLATGGQEGSVVVFQVATALFLLPWAVLAVPVATSAFPLLAASADAGDEPAYAATASRSLRAVLVGTLGAAALLAAVAAPAARVLVLGAPGVPDVGALRDAVTAFAPGLVGYGLLALLARALYARGDGRTPAVATVAGWLAVAGADVALVAAGVDRAPALGLGNTVGMTLAGALLLAGLRRSAGAGSLAGSGRAALAGLVSAAVAYGLSRAVPLPGDDSVAVSLLAGGLLALGVSAVYLAGIRLLDPAGLRALVRG